MNSDALAKARAIWCAWSPGGLNTSVTTGRTTQAEKHMPPSKAIPAAAHSERRAVPGSMGVPLDGRWAAESPLTMSATSFVAAFRRCLSSLPFVAVFRRCLSSLSLGERLRGGAASDSVSLFFQPYKVEHRLS